MRCLFSAVFALVLTACPGSTDGDSIPVDRFYYPSSLAKNGNTLYVANANLDLQYRNGSVLQIDTTTGKVTRSWLIPSLAGEFAHDAALSELWITAQGKPVLTELFSGKTLNLSQEQPYFVSLSAKGGGVLGYLYRTDNILSNENSVIKDFSELQSFEGTEIKQSLRLANCIGDKTDRLRISRIGGVQIAGANVYVLAEMILKPDTQPQRHAFLVNASLAKLGECSATDLSENLRENAVGARGIVISSDAGKAYVLLDENPALAVIEMDGKPPVLSKSVTTCKGPGRIKMTPDGKTLFVLCPRTNQVLAYDSTSLTLLGEVQTALDMTRQGLSPVDMVIDGQELWVSYQNSHQIGILKYENSSSARTLSFVRWFELSR